MRRTNDVVIDNGDASVSLTSDCVYLDQDFGLNIQAVITGSPVGVLKLQASSDSGTNLNSGIGNGTGVTNWTDMANSSQAVNGSGHVVWNIDQVFYKWIRVIYTATSGTGNMTVTANIKGF